MRLILLLLFTLTLLSAQKVALVIGNQNYSSHTRLKNPINDAKLIKKTLEDLGFDVLVAYDVDIDALDKNIDTFMKKANKSDVALIYYAGHGIGVEGRNYLIPIDTHNLSKSNLSRKLISLNELQNSVAKAKKFGVVLFDACRNSFFRQNIEGLGNARASRALVGPTVRHTRNILVSFSTQAGTIAKDDIAGGKHSPYALALSEKLKESKDIRLVMGGVKDRVLELTDNAQEPIDRSSLGGDAFYLYKRNNNLDVYRIMDTYENGRFGFSSKYPSLLLRNKKYSQNGDGVRMQNNKGSVQVSMSAGYNVMDETIDKIYKQSLGQKKENINVTVTYKIQKNNWYVISGYDYDKDMIFYDKRYLINDVLSGFRIIFPINEKKNYTKLVDIIAEGFKPSMGSL